MEAKTNIKKSVTKNFLLKDKPQITKTNSLINNYKNSTNNLKNPNSCKIFLK